LMGLLDPGAGTSGHTRDPAPALDRWHQHNTKPGEKLMNRLNAAATALLLVAPLAGCQKQKPKEDHTAKDAPEMQMYSMINVRGDLAKIDASFPRLADDSEQSSPVSMEEIVGYLRLESPDFEAVTRDQVSFLRTANVHGHKYWIWSFIERDGDKCFVTVSVDEEGVTYLGYDSNYEGLTPEQYMLGDYLHVF